MEISLSSSAAGADPFLYLRNGSRNFGTHIASDDDGGTGNAAFMRVPLDDGSYTVEATSQTTAATGTFDLSIAALSACRADLGTLGGSEFVIKGTLRADCESAESKRLARFYTLALSESAQVILSLSSDYADPVVYLRSGTSGGTTIASNFVHPNIGETGPAFTRSALDAGTYTAEATARVIGAGLNKPFNLSISLRRLCPVAELGEPTSGATRLGTWASDCHSFDNIDSYARYYSFSVSADARVEIDLESREADSFLFLRRGVGAFSGDPVEKDDDGGASTNARIARALPPGAYTVEATTFRPEKAATSR